MRMRSLRRSVAAVASCAAFLSASRRLTTRPLGGSAIDATIRARWQQLAHTWTIRQLGCQGSDDGLREVPWRVVRARRLHVHVLRLIVVRRRIHAHQSLDRCCGGSSTLGDWSRRRQLHWKQAGTKLSSPWPPPRLRGTTWSHVAFSGCPRGSSLEIGRPHHVQHVAYSRTLAQLRSYASATVGATAAQDSVPTRCSKERGEHEGWPRVHHHFRRSDRHSS